MTERRRVVVTGLGALTPLGLTLDDTWKHLVNGESGVRPIALFDAGDLPVRIAGEVPGFDPGHYLDRKQARRLSRTSQLALAAAQAAGRDAGLTGAGLDHTRLGVCVGAGIPGFDRQAEGVLHAATGATRGNPFLLVSALGNMPAAHIAAHFRADGPSSTLVTACASGVQALGEAAELIRRGWADTMIAGGADALIMRVSIVGFDSIGALARDNDQPDRACRPFDATRCGTVLAEGGAMLILEDLAHAQRRGARLYAEILGYSATADNYSLFESDPTGRAAAITMTQAIERAGLTPGDIDYIAAHGTATQANDAAESRAIRLAFGARADLVPASSIKSMIGHTLGAAGAISTAVTIWAMWAGCVPPTINLHTPDPDCDLDYVPNAARVLAVRTALINAFGFGGQNACLVIRKTSEAG